MTKYSVSAVIVLYLLVCTSLEKVKAQQGRRSCSDTTCPANDRCCSDQVLGSICYNPETHSCCENRLLCGLGLGCCQSTCYNTTLFSCTTQGIVANRPPALTITCPQLACPPGNQCCQDSELGAVCYSPTSHWCCASRLLCGRGLQCCSNTCYDPELYSCCSGALCSRQQQQQPAPSTPPPGPVQTAQPTVSVAPPPPPATPAPTQLPTETVRPAGTSTPQPTLPATPAPQPPITPTPAPEVPAQPTPQPQPPAPATPTPVVPIPINTVPPAPVTAGSLEEQVANENCIAFSPYVDNYNPVYGPYPPRSLIDTLLDRMVGINVTCITLYGLGNGLDYAVTAAKARNIKVIVLIWLDLSEQDNEQEIQRAVYVIGNNTETVIAASCGSEVRVRLGPTRALPYIENCISKVRAAGITKPLTTIDSWWGWCQEQYPCRQWSVAQRLDWVGVNIFPWWENQASIVFPCTSADLAPRFVLDRYRDIKRNYPDKQVVITEYGWPAGPSQYSIANLCTNQRCGIASEENQLNVIARSKFVFNRERIPAVLFEAFRQPWTGSGQGAQGPYWGLCSATAPYSCPTLPTVTADQIPGPTPPLAVSPNPPRAICHDRISGLTCYDTAVQTCVNSERLCLRNQATCGPNLICYTPQQQQCCGDRLC